MPNRSSSLNSKEEDYQQQLVLIRRKLECASCGVSKEDSGSALLVQQNVLPLSLQKAHFWFVPIKLKRDGNPYDWGSVYLFTGWHWSVSTSFVGFAQLSSSWKTTGMSAKKIFSCKKMWLCLKILGWAFLEINENLSLLWESSGPAWGGGIETVQESFVCATGNLAEMESTADFSFLLLTMYSLGLLLA